MISKNPNIGLESQYTKQIEILFNQINKEYLKLVKQLMKKEGLDDDVIRAVKMNAFPDILKKVSVLAKKFKSAVYRNSVIDRMTILFSNADKRAKKLLVKVFKEKNIEIPKLKLKRTSVQLREHIKGNVDLIKNITDEHVDSMTKAVVKASRAGFSPKVVEAELIKQGQHGISHAKFITKDQLSKASTAISEERQTSAGVPGYIWIVTNDNKTRESHRVHHNKYYEWGSPPIIDFSLDGDSKRPPEALDPGEDYQCRCIPLASFGDEDKELLSPKIKIRTYDE